MKTMNLIRTGLMMMALAALALGACKKDNSDDEPNTSRLLQTSVDNRLMSAVVDDAARDADKVMSGGNKNMQWVPCNATLDSTFTIADTIVYLVTYNGLNCHGNFFREGSIEVRKHINAHWIDAGTTVYVKFLNVKYTKVSNGKWAFMNGTKAYTNVSGGHIGLLGGSMTSIVHRVGGYLTATFDDGSQRVWNIARTKTFTGTLGNLVCTYEGYGSAGGYNNLETWGINRNGDDYFNQITMPVESRETCDWDLVSGSGIISIPAENITATLTFGYDDNNQPVTNGSCPTRYKVDWVKGNNSGTFFLSL